MIALQIVAVASILAMGALRFFRSPSKTELFAIEAVVAAVRAGIPTSGVDLAGWSYRGRRQYRDRVGEARVYAAADQIYSSANRSAESPGPSFGPWARVDRSALLEYGDGKAYLWRRIDQSSSFGRHCSDYIGISPPYQHNSELELWRAEALARVPGEVANG